MRKDYSVKFGPKGNANSPHNSIISVLPRPLYHTVQKQ